jgi:hypothetical protein
VGIVFCCHQFNPQFAITLRLTLRLLTFLLKSKIFSQMPTFMIAPQ